MVFPQPCQVITFQVEKLTIPAYLLPQQTKAVFVLYKLSIQMNRNINIFLPSSEIQTTQSENRLHLYMRMLGSEISRIKRILGECFFYIKFTRLIFENAC